jgi:hypothetical protein
MDGGERYSAGMDKRKRLQIRLWRPERRQVEELLSGGVLPVRALIRALALRRLDKGRTTIEAGAGVGNSVKAAWKFGKRYQEGGLKAAIYDALRRYRKPLLDAEQGQGILAMVCDPPPAGPVPWSVRLIAQEPMKRKLLEHAGPETLRILLQSHDLKPWRQKCGARRNGLRSPSGTWKTFWLSLESRPRRKSGGLYRRKAGGAAPGHSRSEARSTGTRGPARLRVQTLWHGQCLLRRGFESGAAFPQAHRHMFGGGVCRLTGEGVARFPEARTIYLVRDNLNTHGCKSLVKRYGKKLGSLLWNRFTARYTPKHGSWLNRAEIEVILLSRQCLGQRRIGDLPALCAEVHAWERRINRDRTTINWKLTRKQACRGDALLNQAGTALEILQGH